MTQDEIVKMARETGLVRTGDKWVEPARWGVTELVHFAALVAAAEREWVGLTEAEKVNVAIDCGCADVAWMNFADAIEAKLKEKNGQ